MIPLIMLVIMASYSANIRSLIRYVLYWVATMFGAIGVLMLANGEFEGISPKFVLAVFLCSGYCFIIFYELLRREIISDRIEKMTRLEFWTDAWPAYNSGIYLVLSLADAQGGTDFTIPFVMISFGFFCGMMALQIPWISLTVIWWLSGFRRMEAVN